MIPCGPSLELPRPGTEEGFQSAGKRATVRSRSRIATMANSTELSSPRPKYDFADLSIASVTGLMVAYTVLFLCVLPLIGKLAGGRDFVVYWATGQQLVHHANPFNEDAMRRIEQG